MAARAEGSAAFSPHPAPRPAWQPPRQRSLWSWPFDFPTPPRPGTSLGGPGQPGLCGGTFDFPAPPRPSISAGTAGTGLSTKPNLWFPRPTPPRPASPKTEGKGQGGPPQNTRLATSRGHRFGIELGQKPPPRRTWGASSRQGGNPCIILEKAAMFPALFQLPGRPKLNVLCHAVSWGQVCLYNSVCPDMIYRSSYSCDT